MRLSKVFTHTTTSRSCLVAGDLKIFTSRVFNFPPDGFVTGDVVYKEREAGRMVLVFPVDSILYYRWCKRATKARYIQGSFWRRI